MNLVRLLGNKRVLITLISTALCAIAVRFSLTPYTVSVQCDARWAPRIVEQITHHVTRVPIRTLGASSLRDTLRDTFPCVQNVHITYKSNGHAKVRLVGWYPQVHVRSPIIGTRSYVISSTGVVLDHELFTEDALRGLPEIVVRYEEFDEVLHREELIACALALDPLLSDQYSLIWHNKTRIELIHKRLPLYITADIGSVHDRTRYTYVERIYTQEKKYKKGLHADIRLQDSLICAPAGSKRP